LSRLEFARLNRRLYLGSLSSTEIADYSTVEQSMLELLPPLSIGATASSPSSSTVSAMKNPRSPSSLSSPSYSPASSLSPAPTSSEPPSSPLPPPLSAPQPTDIDTYVGTMPATVEAWRTVFQVMCAHKKFIFAPGEVGSPEAKHVVALGYFAREIEAHLLYNYAVHDLGREQAVALRQAVMTRDRDFSLTGRCVTTAKYRALNLPPTAISAGKMATVSLTTGEWQECDTMPFVAAIRLAHDRRVARTRHDAVCRRDSTRIPPGRGRRRAGDDTNGPATVFAFAPSPPPPLTAAATPAAGPVAPSAPSLEPRT
jgi:hypothetical protein